MSDKIVVVVDPDLADLIPGFLGNRGTDVNTIRAHIAAGNFAEIRVIGHSMKGAGGGYGFDLITDIGARIETAAQAGNSDEILAAATDLEDYLSRVEVMPEAE